MKQLNERKVKRFYQNHLAKMVHSFFMQTLDKKDEEEIKKIWKSFCDSCIKTVTKVNRQYEKFILSEGAWEKIFIEDGYKNIITKPMPPSAKASLLRIIYIVEGKTEDQRKRREARYKFFFLIVRIKYWFKHLFDKPVTA